MRTTNSRAPLLIRGFFVVVLTAIAHTIVSAHDPGLSYLDLRELNNHVAASLSFAATDIEPLCPSDLDDNGEISEAEFVATRTKLEQLVSHAISIEIDGEVLKPGPVVANYDSQAKSFHFELSFAGPSGSKLKLISSILVSLPRGHRQYVSLRNEEGQMIAERMFDASNNVLLVDASTAHGRSSSFSRFVLLGIEHILTGYDHLAFLLVLLLAGSGLKEAGKIITSFTVAHSISLALATLDLVRLPSTVVEPLIAGSIVYVGVENLFRRNFNQRWLLTFGFGLVHGLGFASVLRDLGIGSTLKSAVIPLVSFNTGVEIGQMGIAALVLPVIWKLRRNEVFVMRYVPACSAVVALLGSYWLIERTLLK